MQIPIDQETRGDDRCSNVSSIGSIECVVLLKNNKGYRVGVYCVLEGRSEGIVLAGGARWRGGVVAAVWRRGGGRGALYRRPAPPRTRAPNLTTDPRPNDRHSRPVSYYALNISRERDRLFGNRRAPCFEPVIDSAE
ncbi:unnamed protein product [Colias eurytheme]|nr:unnamed protein product [Colias eurytheme]